MMICGRSLLSGRNCAFPQYSSPIPVHTCNPTGLSCPTVGRESLRNILIINNQSLSWESLPVATGKRVITAATADHQLVCLRRVATAVSSRVRTNFN